MAKLGNEDGQMAVEFALVTPVLIVVGLVVFSLAQYLYLINKFDHVCRQVIVVEGVSPQGDETQSSIDKHVEDIIKQHFIHKNIVVDVSSEYIDSDGKSRSYRSSPGIGALKKYTCHMTYHPVFSDITLGYASSHGPFDMNYSVEVVVDPYRGGVLV